MLNSRIRKLRGKDEQPTPAEPSAKDDEPTTPSPTPAPTEDQDRFASLGEEIAALMRSANAAAERLTTGAEQDATARIQAADEQAAALVAEAETKAAAAHAEAGKQASARLDEATELLETARGRAREIRREADAYAEARRAEHAELIAQATRDRDRATAVIAGARQLLGQADLELGDRIDQATQSLAKLTEMQRALARLEQEHAELQADGADDEPASATTAAATTGGDTGEAAVEGDGDGDGDAVIDLTDADELDDALREAKAKVGDEPSTEQEPASGST